MQGNTYSAHKAIRHLDIIGNVRKGIPARPAHVQIILSDLCNQACNFCAYRDPGYTSSTLFYEVDAKNLKRGLRRDVEHPERNYNPNRMLPYDKVLEILDDCAEMGVSGIQYTGGGEPSVHPRFGDLVVAAAERGLKIGIVTNGVKIGQDHDLAALVSKHASWVRISLDAGGSASYAKIRNVPDSHFYYAIEAIGLLKAESKCVVGVGFVVTPENWAQAYEAASLAKCAGADNLRISAQFSSDPTLFDSCGVEAAKHCTLAESLSGQGFEVINRFDAKIGERNTRPDFDSCGYQQLTTYIGGDMNLYRCCVYAYHPQGQYGTIKDKRFKDAWLNQERFAAMQGFDARSCERCQFTAINKFLDYALRSDDPAHSEFV